MKKNLISICLVLLLCSVFLLASRTQAPQQIKTAYADEAFILSQLPETKQVEADLKAYKKQLENHLKSKTDEYQRKGEEFQRSYERMTDIERADKQEELANIQESILKFQHNAETDMQERQQKKLLPILDKVQRVIDEIAAAGNYNYIFKADALLYAKNSEDVSLAILKRLGVDTSKIKLPTNNSTTSSPTKKSGGK